MPESEKEPEPDDTGKEGEPAEDSPDEGEVSRKPEETGAEAQPRDDGTPDPSGEPNAHAGAARPSRKLSPVEIVSLGAIALLLLVVVFAFRSAIVAHTAADNPDEASEYIALDARGSLLEIASAEIYWREPKPGERVKAGQMLVPAVRIRLGGGPGGTSYLRAVFRDADGEIRGDVTARRIDDGKFTDTGTAEAEIAGTEGFDQKIDFVGYATGTDYWTVELFEGSSYGGKEWARLAYLAAVARSEKELRDTN